MMFQTLVACTESLEEILKESSRIQDPLDIKDVAARFTTDIIGSCAFGIDCNSLKNPQSEFREFGRRIFNPKRKSSFLKFLAFTFLSKEVLEFFRIKQMSPEIENFFMGIVKSTVDYREKNNVQRKDFMQLLLQLKNKGKVEEEENDLSTKLLRDEQILTMNELTAQCFVFFIAGFETSSTTMSFALLELALHQEIQEKLRQEIEIILKKYNGKITYEAVMEMSYLDQVIYGEE